MLAIDLTYPSIRGLYGGYLMKGRTESRAFLAWFLENYYRLDDTELYDCLCDGSYDKGIDGIYVNDETGQIDIFQTTVVQGPKTQGDTGLKEFAGTLSQFKDRASVKSLEATSLNKDLVRILQVEHIATKVSEGYEVRGVYITNASADPSATAFLTITPNIILYDEVELQKGYIHPTKTGPIEGEISFNVKDTAYMSFKIGAELEMVVVPLSAHELVNMEGILNGDLFAWNVRQWLGKKTKVNKDIEKSIDVPTDHKYFPAFHNGLTVLCKNLNANDETIKISSYAVVNGCQSLTSLYTHQTKITKDLKILTKIIKIAPDDDLALKITDHANNQNGITGRDLKSNHPLQNLLQAEIHTKYNGQVYYRIKRGEHPEWDQDKKAIVIENDLAARILLAFDLKQPWSCHQTYKLFDEFHGKIFGRPEVNAERVIALYDIFERVRAKLNTLDNEMFGTYGLTRYFMMYILRGALEKDKMGMEFIHNPSAFITIPNGRERLRHAMTKAINALGTILDSQVTLRSQQESDQTELFDDVAIEKPFDHKRELKNPRNVREFATKVVSYYRVVCDFQKEDFTKWWNESEEAVSS